MGDGVVQTCLGQEKENCSLSRIKPVNIKLSGPTINNYTFHSKSVKRIWELALFLAFPFLFYFWMCPFFSNRTIGEDYGLFQYYIDHQLNFLFSLRNGTFPLYCPDSFLGHSLFAFSSAQFFHPLTYLASIFPAYWNGGALEVNTCIRFLALGLVSFALFKTIRVLKVSSLWAFLITLMTLYNVKTIELFRFTAGFETHLAVIILVILIIRLFLTSKKIYAVLIPFTVYLIICGGNPQIAYFGFMSAGLVLITIPYLVPEILGQNLELFMRPGRFYIKVIMLIVSGIMLASLFWTPYYFDFLKLNISRTTRSFDWVLSIQTYASPIGMLNTFFDPLYSTHMGNFAGNPVMLIPLLVPLMPLFGPYRVPRSIILLWAGAVIVLLMTLGCQLPLYYLFWKIAPFANCFRIPARLTVILIPLFLLIWIWLIRQNCQSVNIKGRHFTFHSLFPLAIIALLCFVSYHSLSRDYWNGLEPRTAFVYRNDIPHYLPRCIFWGSIASLLILMAWAVRRSRVVGLALLAAILLSLMVASQYTAKTCPKEASKTYEFLAKQQKAGIQYVGRHEIWVDLEYGFVTKHYAVVKNLSGCCRGKFTDFFAGYRTVPEMGEVYKIFRDKKDWLNSLAVEVPGERPKNMLIKEGGRASWQLVYGTFDRLRFKLDTTTPGYFVLYYPRTNHWHASIDGRPVFIRTCNVIYQCVEVSKGQHVVEFVYISKAMFWGLILSLITLGTLIVYFSFKYIRSMRYKVALILIYLVVSISFVIIFESSTRGGNDLGYNFKMTKEFRPPPISNELKGAKPN